MGAVQLNILEAISERDKGILQAVSNADAKIPEWSTKAWEMFKQWLSGWAKGHRFMMEHFRVSASARGLEAPPTARAFGQIAVRARKEGLIISNGQRATSSPTAHRCYASEWIKV
jgi:hypothetical protein